MHIEKNVEGKERGRIKPGGKKVEVFKKKSPDTKGHTPSCEKRRMETKELDIARGGKTKASS